MPAMAESMVQWSWQFLVHVPVPFPASHEYDTDSSFVFGRLSLLLSPPIPLCLDSAPLLLMPATAEVMAEWSWQFPVHVPVPFPASHEYETDGSFVLADCPCFCHHQFPCALTVHLCC